MGEYPSPSERLQQASKELEVHLPVPTMPKMVVSVLELLAPHCLHPMPSHACFFIVFRYRAQEKRANTRKGCLTGLARCQGETRKDRHRLPGAMFLYIAKGGAHGICLYPRISTHVHPLSAPANNDPIAIPQMSCTDILLLMITFFHEPVRARDEELSCLRLQYNNVMLFFAGLISVCVF